MSTRAAFDPKETTMLRKIAGCLALQVFTAGAACAQAPAPLQTVRYSCEQGKSLVADYFDGPTRTAPNGMPIPGGHVVLTLPGGKRLTLPQTLSGSGIRYANSDESFVFWSKGNTAFVEEGPNHTQTYSGCVGEKKSGR
jgi:membrane-bound inhibitor of C-type lysozyme